jgi:ABC-type phosphate transport system substrate-binding protein
MNRTCIKAILAAAMVMAAAGSQAQVAVVAGAGVGPLSKDQLSNLYLGRSFEYKLVDLPEGSPTRDQFYKKLADRDQSQIKAMWARVIFTGKGQAPQVANDAAAVKKALTADPKAIAYIDKSAVDSSVKVLLSLD